MKQLIPKQFSQNLVLEEAVIIQTDKKNGQKILKKINQLTGKYVECNGYDYIKRIKALESPNPDIQLFLCFQKDIMKENVNQNQVQLQISKEVEEQEFQTQQLFQNITIQYTDIEDNMIKCIKLDLESELQEFKPYQILSNIQLPSSQALNREQYNQWIKFWPTKFTDEEKQYREEIQEKMKEKIENIYMKRCIELAQKAYHEGNEFQACLLVDSKKGEILAEMGDKTFKNPNSINHCVMEIMKLWGQQIQLQKSKENLIQNNLSQQQIQEEEKYQDLQKYQNSLPNIQQNNKRKSSNDVSEMIESEIKQFNGSNKNSKNQINLQEYYLASNLDMYIVSEPCIMCSMALIHSRIKRLFMVKQHTQNEKGGIYNVEIYNLKSLNHKFKVYYQVNLNLYNEMLGSQI